MEVGAVKQAFNNEVIQLKKNLNQARLQVIHKLTRKAKTLVEKKTADHLKEKNKRKAESAVKEVLIMKKLKPRDIARFIITYKGELISHLNKPAVDSDKACARLLLHKSLQQKYKLIKDKFGDIPIKDLLMSRQERLKLKKEARDAQKNKKNRKEKNKAVNSEGAWKVEEVVGNDDSKNINGDEESDDGNQENEVSISGDEEYDDAFDVSQDDDVSISRDGDTAVVGNVVSDDDDDDTPVTRQVVNDSDESSDGEQLANNDDQESGDDSNDEDMEEREDISENKSLSGSDEELDTEVKLKPVEQTKTLKKSNLKPNPVKLTTADIDELLSNLKPKKKPDKKVKDNKNKNLNEKMLKRKFKKETDDSLNTVKVVDPFFKTATGGNYMSVAEPRQPDEVKEVHRQGNRQERRAVMFGRAQSRPRRDDRRNRSDNYNTNSSSNRFNKGDERRATFNDRNSSNDRNSNYNSGNPKFNDRNSKFNDRDSKFNDRNKFERNSSFNDKNSNNNVIAPKEEKLHPSWEAKKKQSGILPFQGKKTVFDES